MFEELKKIDLEMFSLIEKEKQRQENQIELIASENYVSKAVLDAEDSVLTNKYAEGYPYRRYYGGCQFIDEIEILTQERLKKLFDVQYVNVQPHSGSQANMAVFMALLNPGDRILGMSLDAGGHLTHGYKLSFSGINYEAFSYGLNPTSEELDYDEIEKIALKVRPKMIIAGASAYSRKIDFKRFKEIADKVGAYLFCDVAHIAGLIVTGLHRNPCPYADVVTSTTHKTLRGPRGGIILTNNPEIAKKIDRAVFPGSQGGPLMHIIAAKGVAFLEALDPSFKVYQEQVIKNAFALSEEFKKLGYKIVSGGTDNHLLIVKVYEKTGLTGKEAENLLLEVNIVTNKNTIPLDSLPPLITSGIRLGSPAMTSRGLKEKDFVEIARIIDAALTKKESLDELKARVKAITDRYPLWY
ncbi:MAG: serine hydroxymethyltransferase [Bacilli bacterium]